MNSPNNDQKNTTQNTAQNDHESSHAELQESENPEIIEPHLEQDAENVIDLVHKAQNELAQVQDKYLRLAAEFENYKKRSERDRQTAVKFATEGLLQELLPVIDNLEQALVAAENCLQAPEEKSLNNMVVGIKMVLKQFQDATGRFGIQSFSAKGQAFDPLKHEAVQEKETTDVQSGQVLEDYQKGYMLHERLVRPARVVVSKKVDA